MTCLSYKVTLLVKILDNRQQNFMDDLIGEGN